MFFFLFFSYFINQISILIFCYFLNFYSLLLLKNNFFSILLLLEMLMLISTSFIMVLINFKLISLLSIFLFFPVAICESSLGLGILINFSREWGNDFLFF